MYVLCIIAYFTVCQICMEFHKIWGGGLILLSFCNKYQTLMHLFLELITFFCSYTVVIFSNPIKFTGLSDVAHCRHLAVVRCCQDNSVVSYEMYLQYLLPD